MLFPFAHLAVLILVRMCECPDSGPPSGVQVACAAWKHEYSGIVEADGEMVYQEAMKSCHRVYAPGRCEKRMVPEDLRRFAHFSGLLRHLTLIAAGGAPDGVPDGVALPLFLFEPPAGSPFVLLRAARMLLPVVPVMVRCDFDAPLQPGLFGRMCVAMLRWWGARCRCASGSGVG